MKSHTIKSFLVMPFDWLSGSSATWCTVANDIITIEVKTYTFASAMTFALQPQRQH